MKKLTWADKTYGPVCSCGKRHTKIFTHGHNLPKDSSVKCNNERKS